MQRNIRNKRKPFGWLWTTLLILFAVILVLAFAALWFANSRLNKISYDTQRGLSASGIAATPVPTIDVAAAAELGIILPDKEEETEDGVTNILLLGVDQRLEGTSDLGRADATMLCSLNKKTGEVKLVSFERGIMVPVPGQGTDLLTHAYHWGGAELSQSLIQQCFALDVTGYAQVDIGGFADIIDTIGGVDIELTAVEASQLEIPNAGMNHLNGAKAMMYCRLRYYDDDWTRQQRQRNMIITVLKKLRGFSATELMQLADTVLPMIHTNLDKNEILSLLIYAPKFVNADVQQLQVPDKNRTGTMIKCDFDYESKKISNFLYGTEYLIESPY